MVEELASRLQNKSAAPMHPRCVSFANNLFVSGSPKYHEPIATRVLPVVLKLILYNVTNHIKLKKKTMAAAQAQIEDNNVHTALKKTLVRGENQNSKKKVRILLAEMIFPVTGFPYWLILMMIINFSRVWANHLTHQSSNL